jgi:putative 4-mercaptohistidine N1-methyltranferase
MWARFHFRPHFHQHAGFRLANSDINIFSNHRTRINSFTNKTKTDYESDNVLAQYLALHYSRNLSQKNSLTDSSIKFDFPQKCAELLVKYCQKLNVTTNSVADIGCAVGGTSFELARNFYRVIGIDLSKKFVEVASHLKTAGSYNFDLPIEGDICEQVEAIVDSSIDRTRVQFKQADACALPPDLVGFDAALLINLICRLPSPKACLNRLSGPFGLIRPGGLVLVATPFTWNEEYTPKEVWLGGYQLNNQVIDSREGLMKHMKGNGFTLVYEEDSVMLIREHRRKYQYILPNITLWKRNK